MIRLIARAEDAARQIADQRGIAANTLEIELSTIAKAVAETVLLQLCELMNQKVASLSTLTAHFGRLPKTPCPRATELSAAKTEMVEKRMLAHLSRYVE